MPYFESTPQTSTQSNNYLSVVDIDLDGVASGVYIGNGVVLSAGHVVTSAGIGAIVTRPVELSFAEGVEWAEFNGDRDFSGITSSLPQSDFFINSFTNFGAFGAQDFGFIRINPQGSQANAVTALEEVAPQNRFIVFSDPNDASGELWTAGYVGAGGAIPNVGDGETVTETSTNGAIELQYISGPSLIENELVNNDTWHISNSTGYQVSPGFSGSGAWLDFNGTSEGINVNGTFLAGIVSIGGPTTAQIEPIRDGYQLLAEELFNSPTHGTNPGLALDPNDFGTHVLIADQDGSVTNIVEGTAFNEEIYANSSVGLTVNAEGGDDVVFISEIGGSGVFDGGDGFDTLSISADLLIPFGDGTTIPTDGQTITLRDPITNNEYIIEHSNFEFITITPEPMGPDLGVEVPDFDFDLDALISFPPDTQQLIDPINFIQENETTSLEFNGDASQSFVPIGDDINPILAELIGVSLDEEIGQVPILGTPITLGDTLSTALSSLGVPTTLNNFSVDFGDGINAGDVTQSQVGDDLVFNIDDNGVAKTLTLEDVYADGNADEIASLNFADGPAILSDIPVIVSQSPDDGGTAPASANIINGTNSDNTIFGTAEDDIINGLNGNDFIDGGAGDDTLRGSGGDDTIDGGVGDDSISGGIGNDIVNGGGNNDTIFGQGGNDTLSGDGGADTLRGGSGDDILFGGTGADMLFGQGNNDMLFGGAGNDTLSGAAGSDQLFGGDGNDTLLGSIGADRLDGGSGNDVLNGGNMDGARDTFVFAVGYDEDRVNSFDQAGNDRLELDDALWAGAGTLTAQQVVDMFGSLNASGTILTLDFGNGDILEVQNGAGIDADTLGEDILVV